MLELSNSSVEVGTVSKYDGRKMRRGYPTEEDVSRAKKYLKSKVRWFISSRALGRALGISPHTAGYIIRDHFGFEPWSEGRQNNTRRPYVVTEEYRK